jgi:hypothetical protein
MLFANESASLLKGSLAYSLVSLYFGLRRVSLAEYFLVFGALFPLLMVRCITDIATTVCTRRWATIRTNGNVRSVFSYLMLLLKMTTSWQCI